MASSFTAFFGSRLSMKKSVSGLPITISYTYDDASWMISAGGVAYTYDANGNMLLDGVIPMYTMPLIG